MRETHLNSPSCGSRQGNHGFALVVTLTLMILLTVMAVGLLSLSSISLGSANREAAMQQARAHARMALVIALGELQKHAGPDQRITAKADITGHAPASDVANPHWTGVWNSWAAGQKPDGSPASHGGDDPSEHSTIMPSGERGLAPGYSEGRKDHFRRWLVSLPEDAAARIDTARNRQFSANEAVQLVGPGSLGRASPDDQSVSAALIPVKQSTSSSAAGRYAWWIGDESVKAPILPPPRTRPESLGQAELVERGQSPAQAHHPSIEGLGSLDDSKLDRLLSRRTIDLVAADGSDPQRAFHHSSPWSLGLLTDVREGGFKRDLNAILDRPIQDRDTGDEFMLYRFSNDSQARVPIQDLAAYYQLHNRQLAFKGNPLPGSMQMPVPDFDVENYHRCYSHIYRMPVPVKVQFLLSTVSRPRVSTAANPDPYQLHIGITPAITLWNPYNVPLTLDSGARKAIQLRFFNLPLAITWVKNGSFTTEPTSLSWITNRERRDGTDRFTAFTGWIAGSSPVVFEPGEVRIFSLQNDSLSRIVNTNNFVPRLEMVAGWNPTIMMEMERSTRTTDNRHVHKEAGQNVGGALTFSPRDSIEFAISAAGSTRLADGAALQFFLRQGIPGSPRLGWQDRQFQLLSRINGNSSDFNEKLMQQSFPNDLADPGRIRFPRLSGSQLASNQPRPFLLVSLTAGCEIGADIAGGEGGRRFASRPFLHSSPIHPGPRIDRIDPDAFYQHGWNWSVTDVNSVLEASVQVAPNNRGSYFGGGYTAAYGTTHLVQQEIPITPPMSIGALSHARLGGWSIANHEVIETPPGTTSTFESITATGSGGLYPHTLQAIGNSYAHPYIRPDRISTGWSRQIAQTSRAHEIPLVDHSYLANKALWDKYYFSSLAPRNTPAFAGTPHPTAQSLARKVFLDDEPLPNQRLVTIPGSLGQSTLDTYFTAAGATALGERAIAAHLMVSGPFNVNSTSADAWKAVFSSLRGHPVAVLPINDSLRAGVNIRSVTAKGVPVGGTSLPNGNPVEGSPSDPASPAQWLGWRDLTELEIESLATAMVSQVRRRGPFLSLSEFVNRRLDSDPELALKGALQAALDDPSVPINAAFRTGERVFSVADLSGLNPEFPEALEGPIALGSNAYIDQADLLRHLGAILCPRGDTFLIRTYGDAVDTSGKVTARAWCEAVVQRMPEYLDRSDPAHSSAAELKSSLNETFGRTLQVVSFRWLNPDEV